MPRASATTPPEVAARTYALLAERVDGARALADRPLALTEKLIVGHLTVPDDAWLKRGDHEVALQPDRLAMPDSSAQTALLQFLSAGLHRTAVPTTIHCDHLVRAEHGAEPDLRVAASELGEIYEFLRQTAAHLGLGFWEPGTGIIHQVVLENYAFPGCLLVGTDSHTQNGGGLGMLASGIGGAEAVDVLAGLPWTVRAPRIIGVRLTGQLSGWATAKDVILAVTGILTVDGATGAVIEYFGPGAESISATGKATICNMGTETGATSSLFPYDSAMSRYLISTGRAELDRLATLHAEYLRADPDVIADPAAVYDQVIDLDLDTLEPQISGPTRPDRVRPVRGMSDDASEFDLEISSALIGSCTNSSYEDIGRAAHIARQAAAAGLHVKVPLYITPGSHRALATLKRDGLLADLESIGATVLASACGPCIGQWRRTDGLTGRRNSIVSSFNRNFPRRNDGAAETASFLASPTTVVVAALAGRLDFDPRAEYLDTDVRLVTPTAAELPADGWVGGATGFREPPDDGRTIAVEIDPRSERLQRIAAFPPRRPPDFADLPVLVRVDGRCTTDHISPAGPWLPYRGHLEKLSDNMLLGAVNVFTGNEGTGIDQLAGGERPLPTIAKSYRDNGIGWAIVGGDNYGEGSSREHAAMTPRYLGAALVLANSFARIHEANLKRQAILPLTFADPADRAALTADCRLDVIDIERLAPGAPVRLRARRSSGSSTDITAHHTLTAAQVSWLWAGSALNQLRVARLRSARPTSGD